MPKFTLIKHAEYESDAEVSVTFETDHLGLAKDHFDDFLKASGFEMPLDNAMSRYLIPDPSEWDWDDDGEWRINLRGNDGPVGSSSADIIEFPNIRN